MKRTAVCFFSAVAIAFKVFLNGVAVCGMDVRTRRDVRTPEHRRLAQLQLAAPGGPLDIRMNPYIIHPADSRQEKQSAVRNDLTESRYLNRSSGPYVLIADGLSIS